MGHFNEYALGMTPIERWDAMTEYSSGSGISPWIILAGVVIIVLLIALLLIMYNRQKQDKTVTSRQRFDEYAQAKELTDRQYRLLTQLAANAQLKRDESIFTLPSVFDREADKMIQNAKTQGPGEQIPQLEVELGALREKLDFSQYTPLTVVSTAKTDTQSTRQMPPKKKIYIKRNHRSVNGDLQATVIENTSAGLLVQFPSPVEVIFGQTWICRYHAGPFVAEFMTSVSKCSGCSILLHHSNHVRLINRRKILRVPIQKPAFMAAFPFRKNPLSAVHQKNKRFSKTKPDFELPQFYPATITELGGPGLRIRTDLNVRPHDRVLLMFKLDQYTRSNSSYGRKNFSEHMIEHIAKVRHIIKDDKSTTVALELIGLSDNEMDELIRITNEIAISIRKKHPNVRPLEASGSSSRQLLKI